MPGVPSGRGCDGCRKQKKKCDQGKPACGRCTRLKIPCIGCGEQRYKFKDQTVALISSTKSQSRPPTRRVSPVQVLVRMPSNQITTVANALISRLEINDIRYDITCYGAFLTDIPKRLGTNEALDASVSALTTCFTFLHTDDGATTEALTKYIRGLKTLRTTLSNPVTAQSPETLCAIYFMMICQGWMGRYDDHIASHGEGIAYILKSESSHKWREQFEVELMITLCVPVIVESISNPRIQLESWFWQLLDAYAPKNPGCEAPASAERPIQSMKLRNVAKIPSFIRQPAEKLTEIWPAYHQLLADLKRMRKLVDEIDAARSNLDPDKPYSGPETRAHRNYQTAYGVLLTLSMVLNGVLQALHPGNTALQAEAQEVAELILILANEAREYRPLGAGHVPLSLTAAWAVADDARPELEAMIADYQRDFVQFSWMDMARWWRAKFTNIRRGRSFDYVGEWSKSSESPDDTLYYSSPDLNEVVDTRRYCDMCRVQ